jgi:hypothetical protein
VFYYTEGKFIMSWEDKIKKAKEIHNEIANDLEEFGYKLKCNYCGKECYLTANEIGYFLAKGWPTCCGQTMQWVTENKSE